MFHMGKPIESIAQTHKISIQRVNKIISNQTGMSNTKTHPRQLRGKAFNAKVKAYANQGLSFNDIASIMGCSYSTIKRAFDDTKPKKKSVKAIAKTTPVAIKNKSSNKRTASFSILWGAISFSRTTTLND
jgi:transposase-like protein